MCFPKIQESLVFTTEPELTRALAAEIRNEPSQFQQLLAELLAQPLDDITQIACEEKERLDLVLTCCSGNETKRIGIEAKCDHVVTPKQLEREKEVVDYLLLLVLDKRDAEPYREKVDGVMTWEETLGCFHRSRLTSWDLDHIPAQKRTVERLFNEVLPSMRRILTESEWGIEINRNGSGMPHIDIVSHKFVKINGKEKQIRGNIQVAGRGKIQSLENVRLQCFVGIAINEDDSEDFPRALTTSEPAWIIALKQLDAEVLQSDGEERYPELAFRKTPGRRRKNIPHMGELVDRYLSKQRYLIKGYAGWAFGARSQPFAISDLEDNAKKAANLFKIWKSSLDGINDKIES